MRIQSSAGYILESLRSAVVPTGGDKFTVAKLFAAACCFDADITTASDGKKIPELTVFEVAANLLTRGLPTRASLQFNVRFEAAFPEAIRNIGATMHDGELASRRLSAALLPYDPRLSGQDSIKRFQGVVSQEFLKLLLPAVQKTLGAAAIQLLRVQESSLLLPLPIAGAELSGVRFLPDGTESKSPLQATWITIEVGKDAAALNTKLAALVSEHPAQFQPLIDAGRTPLLRTEEGMQLLQLLYSPLGAARIQHVLLDCILSGVLDLSAAEWDIAIVERDVPCAAVAVEDLTTLLERLFVLEGASRKLPRINLQVYASAEFANSPLHAAGGLRPTVLAPGNTVAPCGLLLDVAMLRTADIPEPVIPFPETAIVRIRSAVSMQNHRPCTNSAAMVYKGLGRHTSAGFEISDEAEAALLGLLEDVFGYTAFKPGQLEFLSRLLRGEHVITAMPPAAGKTLPVLLASVLQSTATLIVAPSSDLLCDTAAALDAAGIDGYILLREEARRDERLASLRMLSGGNVLISLVPAKLFDSEDVRNALVDARRTGVTFARAVIDEAHSCSEWSHDPRFAMQHIAGRVCAGVSSAPFRHVPLAMLTASMSPRVHSHLLGQLASALQLSRVEKSWLLLIPGALPPGVRLTPIVTSADSLDETSAEIRKLLTGLPEALRRAEEHELRKPTESDTGLDDLFSEKGNGAVVVFAPDAATVSQRYGANDAGLAENLAGPPFRIARYTGTDVEHTRVGRQILRDAAAERKSFSRGEANLLVSTRAWGIGSHRTGVRATIHTQPSASVARLIQECSRAGHNGEHAYCYVRIPKRILQRKAGDGKQRSGPDLQQGFSSAAREKQILSDILKEITYPEDTNTSRIANLLSDEFGIPILTSYWQRNLDERLYLQTRKGESLGYIDLVALTVVPDASYTDQTFARDALEFAYRQSIAEAGSGPSLSAWVSATFPSDVEDGILRQMKDFDIGAGFTLRIGFENDKEPILTQIHSLLWRRADIQIQRKILSEIAAETWESFTSQIEERTQQLGVFANMDQDLGLALQQMFLKIRSRADTERAILRMMALGAVSDAVAYPASRRFALTVNVRRDAEYREALENYVRMLMPEKDAERVLQVLPTYTGDSVLEQCLFFLIDHLYRWIGEFHDREAADLDFLLRTAEREDAEQRFHATAVHTLISRYARPDGLPRTLEQDGRGQLRELLLIVEGLEADGPGAVLEHARHVRRSCEMLLQTNPHSALLEALMALADAIDPIDPEAEKTVQSRLADAVLLCLALSRNKTSDCETSLHRLGMILRRHLTEEYISNVERKVRDRFPEMETLRSEREALIQTTAVAAPPPPRTTSTSSGRSAVPSEPPAPRTEATTVPSPSPPPAATPAQRPSPPPLPEVQPAVEKKTPKVTTPTEAAEVPGLDIDSFEQLLNGATSVPSGTPSEEMAAPTPPALAKKALPSVTPAQSTPRPAQVADDDARKKANVDAGSTSRPPLPSAQTKQPAPAPIRPMKPEPAFAIPDPELSIHLNWLRTFNNSFLKGYEAGNE
jgi:ATP-dependent DNA helicase RecQ